MSYSPCQRTLALFKPGQPQPGGQHCYSRKVAGEARVCELCGEVEPAATPARPKKGSFADVFGHLGTPEEVAAMWTDMQDRLEDALRPLKAWEIADAFFDALGENLDTYDLRMFDFAREIEKRHGSPPKQVPVDAAQGSTDHHPV